MNILNSKGFGVNVGSAAMRGSCLVLLSLFGLWQPATLRASTVMGDAFITGGGVNYTANANLSGQNPSSSINFTSAWSGVNSLVFRPQSTNLSMAGITNPGGELQFNVTGNSAFSRSDYRTFTAASTQSTLWFGTLYQPSTNGLSANSQAMVGFLSGNLTTTTDATSTGATWSNANGGSLNGFAWGVVNGSLVVDYQSGAGTILQANTGVSLTSNMTYFLIGKLEINESGNDILNIWVSTSAPASETALGAATLSITTADLLGSSSELNTLNLWTGTESDGSINKVNNFDAISLGTTYLDLLSVPEPSSSHLILITGLFLTIAFHRTHPKAASTNA